MNKFTKTISNFALFAVVVGLMLSAVQAFYMFMPMTFWIEYKSVEPMSDFKVGELPKFVSIVETYRDSNVMFSDVLFCKFTGEEEFDYYVEYKSGSFGKKPEGIETNQWTFHPAVPLAGECYCRSSIILQLPFGINRVQKIRGKVFEVTE